MKYQAKATAQPPKGFAVGIIINLKMTEIKKSINILKNCSTDDTSGDFIYSILDFQQKRINITVSRLHFTNMS